MHAVCRAFTLCLHTTEPGTGNHIHKLAVRVCDFDIRVPELGYFALHNKRSIASGVFATMAARSNTGEISLRSFVSEFTLGRRQNTLQ